jgi:hypothetical protein
MFFLSPSRKLVRFGEIAMFCRKNRSPSRESRGFSTSCKSACKSAGKFAGRFAANEKRAANLTNLANLAILANLAKILAANKNPPRKVDQS